MLGINVAAPLQRIFVRPRGTRTEIVRAATLCRSNETSTITSQD